jgi:hypothetical protein
MFLSMQMSSRLLPALAFAAALGLWTAPTLAEEMEELDANATASSESDSDPGQQAREDALALDSLTESRACVSTVRIRSTDIIDDRTIVFRMNNSEIYLNRLRNRCSGLRMAGSFSYEVRSTQLCDLDIIRVLDYIGGELRPGVGCGLGKFRLITKEQLEILRESGIDDS